uniref:Uncharacterized protein n=1 Tax=Vitis vinifera TaxID=29760 RepID=F6H5N0_VITVI
MPCQLSVRLLGQMLHRFHMR